MWPEWMVRFIEPFRELARQVYAYLPRLLLAFVLLFVGWMVARALRLAVVRVLERLKRLVPGGAAADERSEVERLALRAIGALVFWLVILLSFEVAFEVLGLPVLTNAFVGAAAHLPKIIAAVLVAAGGVLLANFAGTSTERAARSAGVAYAGSVGKVVRASVLLVAIVIALAQAGLDSTLLVVALGTILGAFLGAVALAFGLGAHLTVSNLIASHYLQRTYQVNQRVRIGEHEGRIVELRPTGVVLDTPAGVVLVPGRKFSEQASVLLAETE